MNQTELEIEIANLIVNFYDYCDYPIIIERSTDMAEMIVNSWKSIKLADFEKFIKEAKGGQFGMIFKSPVSFMAAFNIFKRLNIQIMP